MTQSIEIQPTGPLHARIRPPGSKSLTNRALICAALADGDSTLSGALESEDTRVMVEALRRLGIAVTHDLPSRTIRLTGCGGRLPTILAQMGVADISDSQMFNTWIELRRPPIQIDVANSGTSLRFLTALLTLGQGTFRLDGSPRMRQRPVQDLLDALAQLGGQAASELGTGCPPVVLTAHGLPGGKATIAGSVSSQFLSGLLMAAPYARSPVDLTVSGELVSQPYVKMTLAVMRAFGVSLQTEGLARFLIPAGQVYRGLHYPIEPDASAASYFFAAAAITGGSATVEGLSRGSLQGDVAFCECLRRMGCSVDYAADAITVTGGPLVGIQTDMNAISDTVQTLAAVALFARGPTTISGVAHIRHKETDRIAALAAELRKLGAEVEERADGLQITPRTRRGAVIDTYDDHRMAMSMAIVGLAQPGVVIRDPECTAKTYPEFFDDLRRLETVVRPRLG
jgi:3-phosphoshikimate 1-carboxyvinyltransferase